jgi:chromosomal replication initiator protein
LVLPLNFWAQTLESCRNEFSTHVFNTWIKPLEVTSDEDGNVCLHVPNSVYRDKIKKFYLPFLEEAVQAHVGSQKVKVSLALQKRKPVQSPPQPVERQPEKPKNNAPAPSTFQQAYTFDAFVVGGNNHLAHAASEAVSREPGQKFNPLLIYGGVGLGKTHLLHAIGNQIQQRFANKRVVYRTSEQFMNDLIESIRFQKMDSFRTTYRNACDVLLIDDIQFFSGKERTQEEFFHTFNVLQQEGKQIVLTSDRMPSDIPELDNRLRSRFQAGLFCDIQRPDFETRVAILQKKAVSEQIDLPEDVCLFMAKHIESNIRILEGSLIRLGAMASLRGHAITLPLAQSVVATLTTVEKRITVEDIMKRVATFYHIKVSDLKSAKRVKTVSQPRQIAMYLARKLTQLSFPEIGSAFGGKDHTTIMHGVGKIEKLLTQDPALLSSVEALQQNIARDTSA